MSEIADKRILVVDDEEDVRKYLSSALKDAGFIVETASDGFEALDAIKKQLPDLISLDLVMPKHSGLKFYRDLQKGKDWKTIPVLIVTGHAKDDLGKADFDTMMMQGPGIYLEKPVKPDTYVQAVCKMLNIDINKLPSDQKPADTDKLKDELAKQMNGADADALQKALDALKKK